MANLILPNTLLHLTVNLSPEGVTAPSGVVADSLGWNQTQLMGRGQLTLIELLPFVVGLGGPLALLFILITMPIVRFPRYTIVSLLTPFPAPLKGSPPSWGG
jgi:hypothetical protein